MSLKGLILQIDGDLLSIFSHTTIDNEVVQIIFQCKTQNVLTCLLSQL